MINACLFTSGLITTVWSIRKIINKRKEGEI